MSAARPQVTVHSADGQAVKQVALPAVFLAPIRSDIVQFVHTNMNKNRRQAYAVFDRAGQGHSAKSWGTGRAVSRIPRVSGGGTSRAGQATFGNMCRKGRMFGNTRPWRRWHRQVNVGQKRYAVCSALAASALPALVMARGHSIEDVPELPLVVSNDAETIKKTKAAVALLEAVGAYDDVEKAAASKQVRSGSGKARNRRYVLRRGPLVVYANNETGQGIKQAFRNLPGVDLAHVDRLNLLQLAPGGHLGRFIVWTEAAFARASEVFGSLTRASVQKSGFKVPQNIMSNSDITRIINSDEVQSKLRATLTVSRHHSKQKKNPLKNFGVMVRLNPYAQVQKRARVLASKSKNAKKASKHPNSQKIQNYKALSA
jgi:large subunit ribosomal protein L4e